MSRSLKIARPLAILDLETTGTSPSMDRIVEIAILKIHPDGTKTRYHERVNPGIPIPPEATKVHGIGDQHVEKCAPFQKQGAKIREFLKNCDLAGYNLIRFDLPLLQTEFARSGIKFSLEEHRVVDACQIFHRKEPRDLTAALRFFCGEEHSEAHSALHDVRACWKVLTAQIRRYTDLPLDLQELHNYCNERDERFADAERKFEWRHNEATFTFGKYKGCSLRDVAKDEPGFLEWMLTKNFGAETKAIVEKALNGKFPKRVS